MAGRILREKRGEGPGEKVSIKRNTGEGKALTMENTGHAGNNQ
jgi:hypothetical protein